VVTEPGGVAGATGRAAAVRELALLFLRLGATSFGGPAVHIALMENEVVRRRQWLTREEFLDLLGATNLIPGPNSTEMAIHIGHRRAGWPGLLVGGTCFIAPAMVIVWALAWAYARYGALPEAAGLLWGLKPVVIAVVVQAIVGLSRTAIKNRALALVGLAAVALTAVGVHELLVLLGCGAVAILARGVGRVRLAGAVVPVGFKALAATATGAAASSLTLGALFLAFLKVGAVLFGSGYVLLALLRAELVSRLGWLTESQLLDAVAIGQVTPGPVFTTATFIGYVLGGNRGALVATVGIFLPAFIFVALSGPLVPRLRRSAAAGAFLDGVNVGSLGLMAVVTWQLGRAAVTDLPSGALAAASAFLLLRHGVNPTWLVLAGGVLGVVRVFV
jgi:chromate transporter